MSINKSIFGIVAIVTACSNKNESPAASPSTDQLSLFEATDFCVHLHEHAALCAVEFTDLNIELRRKYFPDFAEKAKDPATLAAMREEGKGETLADGSGPLEPRRERCKGYAEHGPPTPRSAVPRMEACYTKNDCREKMDCMRPLLDERYKERAKGQ